MGNLSKNFSAWEFACKCGCGANKMSPWLIDRLQQMRTDAGKAITVTSGARCAGYNAQVGGMPDSEHIPDPETGEAEGVDIAWKGSSEYHILDHLAHQNFRRIGQADNFLHLGVRASKPQDVTWRYPSKVRARTIGWSKPMILGIFLVIFLTGCTSSTFQKYNSDGSLAFQASNYSFAWDRDAIHLDLLKSKGDTALQVGIGKSGGSQGFKESIKVIEDALAVMKGPGL